MSFTSISSRISTMPLVLVGPILRRVTNNSVSVFVVTRESTTVELTVYDTDANELVLSGTTPTIALGEHIHVLVVTTVPVSGNALTPGKLYHYNLKFDGIAMVQSNGTLTNGILVNGNYSLPEGIAYGNQIYPTFLLPSDNADQLKFVHASCRKPHGGVTDALRGLDTILSTTISSGTRTVSLNARPQFLCLTGDQIYADDVADAMLYMIIDIEEHLFNWGTPNTRETLPTNPPVHLLTAGHRHDLVATSDNRSIADKFTSKDNVAKSHLIRLAEYYGMYLMVWSDVLWPALAADFPDFQHLYPGVETTEEVSDYIPDFIRTPRRVNTERYQSFLDETNCVVSYCRSLKFVRKALANIPTYMMFDDHEITDDWFLTREWTQNVLNPNGLTKRILQNGLAAFAVFQAWGNTPDRFISGDGALILGMLSSLTTNGGDNTSVFQSIGNLVLPRLNGNATKLEGGFQWNFQLSFDLFELIVLDTRTKRGYRTSRSAPALIHVPEISAQIDTSSGKELAIIVSPAPIFGNFGIELLQLLATAAIGNPYDKDFEAWVFHGHALHTLLQQIADFPSSILLSGDVHYAFSASIEYWKTVGGIRKSAGIAQLCSSSLKNSDSSTESAATNPAVRPRLRNSRLRDTFYAKVHDSIGVSYRLHFESDRRHQSQRLGTTPIPVGEVNSQFTAGFEHYNSFSFGGQTYVVGRDNIGFVHLAGYNSLQHEFWFVMGPPGAAETTVLQPSTIHTVPFGPPTSSPPTVSTP